MQSAKKEEIKLPSTLTCTRCIQWHSCIHRKRKLSKCQISKQGTMEEKLIMCVSEFPELYNCHLRSLSPLRDCKITCTHQCLPGLLLCSKFKSIFERNEISPSVNTWPSSLRRNILSMLCCLCLSLCKIFLCETCSLVSKFLIEMP